MVVVRPYTIRRSLIVDRVRVHTDIEIRNSESRIGESERGRMEKSACARRRTQ